jgi:autotransporter-associated beta strand protein
MLVVKTGLSGNYTDSKKIKSNKQRVRASMLSLAAMSAVSLAAGIAHAQSEIVGWNTSSLTYASNPNVNTFSATTVDPGLASAPTLSYTTEGNPYGSPAGLNPGLSSYFTPGFLVWSSQNSAGLGGAQAQNQWTQFTLTPSTGKSLDVDSIEIPNWYTQGFAATMYVTSSLDGYASSLGSAALTSGSNSPISLGSSLQNITSPVTIRLNIAGNWSYQTAGFGGPGSSGDSLEVLGSVAAPVTGLTWTGTSGSAGNGTWNTSQTNTWKSTSGGAAAVYGDGDPITFDSTGTNTNITVAGGGVNPGTISFNSGTYTIGGGPIGGTTATTLTVSGGALTLSSSNTFAGGTTVTSGTLTAGNDSALGTGSVVVNGGTLNFTSATPSVPNLSGTGGSVVLSNTNLSIGSDNTSTTYSGSIGQAASTTGGLTKVGSGTLSLAGSSTYKGATAINAGTLLAINATGSATGSGNVTVASGAILGGSGFVVPGTGNSVTVQSGGILSPHVTANGFNTLTVTGALNLNAGSLLNFNLGSTGNDEVIANSVVFGGSSETLNVSFPNGATSGVFPILKASSFSGLGAPVFNVVGTAADAYTVLAPGAAGNSYANTYALKAVIQTTTWTGATSNNWDTTEANWNGPAGTYYADGMPVVFDDTASTYTVKVIPTEHPYSMTFNNSLGHNYNVAALYNYGHIFDGGASVTLNGTGTVTFGGNTYDNFNYSGGVFLNAGVLNINDDNKLGTQPSSNAVSVTFKGGALQAGIADLQLTTARTFQVNAGGGTFDTNGNTIEINGNLIQGPGGLTVTGGGTLKMNDGYYSTNSGTGNLDQNTYAGGTVVNGTTVEVSDTDSSSNLSGGTIVSGLFGTGPVTLNNGSGLQEDNYKETYYANAFNLGGTLAITPANNGLFFSAAAGNITTLTSDTVLNLSSSHRYGNNNMVFLNLDQPVVGAHSLTINGVDTSALYTGVVFGSASSNFSGGVTATNAQITVGTAGVPASSTVTAGVLTSGPLGTGLVTLNTGAVLAGLDDGTDVNVVSNSVLVNGNTTFFSGHNRFVLDAAGTGNTFTFANTPTLTNDTGYDNSQPGYGGDSGFTIANYTWRGTGFNLVSAGTGDPLHILTPGTSVTGLTTSVTVTGSTTTLIYDVGTLSASGSFEFGQQAINLAGGTFSFHAGYMPTATATLTNAINVNSSGGTLTGLDGYYNATCTTFSGPVNAAGPLSVSYAVLSGGLTGSGAVTLTAVQYQAGGNAGVILATPSTVPNSITTADAGLYTLGSSDNGSAGVSTFSGPVSIFGGGNLNVSAGAGGTAKFTNMISGPGSSLTKVGDGTVILSGSNTYTGTTLINTGTLEFANEASLYGGNKSSWTATNINLTGYSNATLAFGVGGPGQFTSSDLDLLQANLKTGTGGFQPVTNLGLDTSNASGGSFTYNSPITDIGGGGYPHNGLTKLGSGALILTSSSNTYTGPTTVLAGVLVEAGGTATLGTSNAIIVNGGGIIFSGTSTSEIFNDLQAGYNGGAWNGTSYHAITSATAAADPTHLHALGMLQPAAATTFEGQSLGTGDVAVKYTYYGDANLDGRVTSTDYTKIDNGFLSGLTGWQNGDFNYDGTVNGSDYTLIDNAFNTQGAQIAAEIASPTAQIAVSGASSAVPEPATLGLLAFGTLGLLGRRNRRSR